MRQTARALILCGIAAAAGSVLAAGAVNVNFVNATAFSDTGVNTWDKQANLDTIAKHLQSLGQRYLGGDQVLKVDVLDVDLAGEHRISRRRGNELRIARGGADWLRMTLSYSLEVNGAVLQSGSATIKDMDYMHHVAKYESSDALRLEKQMLDDWLNAQFDENHPAYN